MTPSGPRTKATAEQLQSIAQTASVQADLYDDDDERAYFLSILEELDWTKTDNRWRAAEAILRFDRIGVAMDPLWRELNTLLVQIAVQGADACILRGEYADREDVQQTARELREATDRLSRIVYAATAIHSLGSGAA